MPQTQVINVAASANGATASAQNYTPDGVFPGCHFQPAYAIDGQRYMHLTANDADGFWRDEHGLSSWLQVDFNGLKTISEIDVYTAADYPAYLTQADPSPSQTFSQYGVTAFDVQYWSGSSWISITGASITSNNLVWRKINFGAVTTAKIRVVVNGAVDSVARVVELEAWGIAAPPPLNVALASNGATASAQNYTADGVFPGCHFQPAYAIDGQRYMHLTANDADGFWRDEHGLPSWLQVDFNGSKTISEVDVFTAADYPAYFTQADPSPTQTFSQYGAPSFEVQYWNGSTWAIVPGGSIAGNNLVWRKINFAPITTSKLRVVVNSAVDGVARIIEFEAWTAPTGSISDSDFAMARLDPHNRTGTGGEDLLSNNFNWSLPLVGLPGRGLDLGLTLSYNSLVWTRSGNYVDFDLDQGSIAPGFRLGFPTVEGPYFNSQSDANFYLLVTPSGARVELRQISSGSTVYESKDSTYLQLTDNLNGTATLRPTDGSQLNYISSGGGWRCNKITDRNGNFISATYKSWGEIETVTDTLGRVLTFLYDSNDNIQEIRQTWGNQTHQWATFGWGTASIGNNFSGLNNLGPNSATIPVLTQVGLPDGSRYTFEYPANGYGTVSTIRYYAYDANNPNHERNHTTYTFSVTGIASDGVPRVTERKVAAEYWNGVNGVPAEVATQFSHDTDGGCRMTMPDGTVYKEYYGSGWQAGLTTESRNYATVADANANIWQKKTTASWTQENLNVGFLTNPRVTQTDIEDASGNHRRTTIDYGDTNLGYVQWGLPYIVKEYASDGTTELRRTQTDYNLSQTYLTQRIIGLVSSSQLYDAVANQWQAKTTYSYDDNSIDSQATTATQHNQTYNSTFTTRGNVTSVSRWDVTDIENTAKKLTSTVTYNAAGSVVSSTDPAGHTSGISYADSFSDNQNHNTFAYPTTLTDADGFSSTVQYRFEFGAKTRVEGPPPQNQPNGAIQTFTYDDAARIQQVTTTNTGAYTRYIYGPDYVESLSSVNNLADEAYTFQLLNGRGQVFISGGNHPGSSGGYRAQTVYYDVMGRVMKQSNPTEINGSWAPSGDDAAGWQLNNPTEYDWKGRLLKAYNMDGTYKTASYTGCGCAGGEVVTLTDEMTRRQKVYSDVLGRTWKTEVLNWDGTVYSTTTTSLNARDQVTLARQFAGTDQSTTYQDTTLAYDGYGRLQSKHVPEQNAGTSTVYSYNSDDTVLSATDARGASATYGYNNRHLVTSINYSVPQGSNIPATPNVTFGYDAAGNRSSMTDGSGLSSYAYDQLSRLQSETRQFNGLSGSYTLSYQYNLVGELTQITEPSGSYADYTFDSTGRLTSVTGAGLGASQYLASAQYRAWGGLKSLAYGNSTTLSLSYNSRSQLAHYSIGGVKAYATGPIQPEGGDFQYYADSRIKFAADLRTDATASGLHDRAYSFDHVGRLKEAYSGYEARDFLNGTNSGNQDGAFRQSYAYDSWSNLTSRTGRFWSEDDSATDSYNSQNRNPAWEYDPDGRLLSRNEASPNGLAYQPLRFVYDASGRRVQSTQTTSRPNPIHPTIIWTTVTANAETYDGDGVRIKTSRTSQLNNNAPTTASTFFLRSSVTGNLIAEYDASGVRQKAYVFAGRDIIAEGQRLYDGTTRTVWQHANPVTGDGLNTDAQGVALERTNTDPMGVNVGDTDPFVSNEPTNGGDGEGMSQSSIDAMVAALIPGWGGPTCKVDGAITGCRFAFGALSSGAGVLLNPGANTTPRVVVYQGQSVLATYRATYDGYQGLMPVTAQYTGNGNFAPISSGGPPSLQSNTLHDTNFAALNHATGEAHLAQSPQNTYDPRVDFRDYAVQLSKDKSKTDCLKLALLVYKAGLIWGDSKDGHLHPEARDTVSASRNVMNGLMGGLTEFSEVAPFAALSDEKYRVGVFSNDTYYADSFEGSGFSQQFIKPTEPHSNRVRHAVAYMVAGYSAHVFARRLLYDNETVEGHPPADMALGYAAINLGSNFTGDYRALAQGVWHNICGQSSNLNLP